MAKKTITSKEFLEELKKVASKYPEFAGTFAIAKVRKEKAVARKPTAGRKCVRYGVDPVTGEKICLEWKLV